MSEVSLEAAWVQHMRDFYAHEGRGDHLASGVSLAKAEAASTELAWLHFSRRTLPRKVTRDRAKQRRRAEE